MGKIRLQKIIAGSGALSRRKAEEAIVSGRVRVNGEVITALGSLADPYTDHVELDGNPIQRTSRHIVLALNKPRGVVSTRSDPEGRPTLLDLLPQKFQTLKPVGRLDFGSEGLILLTNHGELANRIMHPSYGVLKTYQAELLQALPPRALRALVSGIELEDGKGRFETLKPVSIPESEGPCFEVTVSEGRNRFIRRMFEKAGSPVRRLKRTGIGHIGLDGLLPGEYRALSPAESLPFLNVLARVKKLPRV